MKNNCRYAATYVTKKDMENVIKSVLGFIPSGQMYGVVVSDFELKNNTTTQVVEKIEITHDGKKTTARYCKKDGSIIKGVARCHPDDEFNFRIGADLAYARMTEKIKQTEFKPHLVFNDSWIFEKEFLGYIGEETTLVDIAGNKLKVGDVVNIFDKDNGKHIGVASVVRDNRTSKYEVMGSYNSNWKNGISEESIIIKIKDCTEIKDREIIDKDVKYILTPEK